MLPPNSPFFLINVIAQFVQQRFCWNVMNTPKPFMDALPSIPLQLFLSFNPGLPPPLNLPAHLVTEAELLASMAAKVLHNRGKLCLFTILFNLITIPKSLSSICMLTNMIYLCQRSLPDRIKLRKTDSVPALPMTPHVRISYLQSPALLWTAMARS